MGFQESKYQNEEDDIQRTMTVINETTSTLILNKDKNIFKSRSLKNYNPSRTKYFIRSNLKQKIKKINLISFSQKIIDISLKINPKIHCLSITSDSVSPLNLISFSNSQYETSDKITPLNELESELFNFADSLDSALNFKELSLNHKHNQMSNFPSFKLLEINNNQSQKIIENITDHRINQTPMKSKNAIKNKSNRSSKSPKERQNLNNPLLYNKIKPPQIISQLKTKSSKTMIPVKNQKTNQGQILQTEPNKTIKENVSRVKKKSQIELHENSNFKNIAGNNQNPPKNRSKSNERYLATERILSSSLKKPFESKPIIKHKGDSSARLLKNHEQGSNNNDKFFSTTYQSNKVGNQNKQDKVLNLKNQANINNELKKQKSNIKNININIKLNIFNKAKPKVHTKNISISKENMGHKEKFILHQNRERNSTIQAQPLSSDYNINQDDFHDDDNNIDLINTHRNNTPVFNNVNGHKKSNSFGSQSFNDEEKFLFKKKTSEENDNSNFSFIYHIQPKFLKKNN